MTQSRRPLRNYNWGMDEISRIIQHYHMQPLPGEGGYFVRTYLSDDTLPAAVLPDRYGEEKPFRSMILYLITAHPQGFSALHTLLTDEILDFYLGDPLETLLLYPDGSSRRVVLGQKIFEGQQIQLIVPRGVWQGTHLLPGGQYALIGAGMAPAYTDHDFTLGKRKELSARYPAEADLIARLTRE